MERLTFDGNFCDMSQCAEVGFWPECKTGGCSQRKVWERLKRYEDLEEQGRLVVLPCSVGDTVWIASRIRGAHSAKVRTFFCGHPAIGGEVGTNIQMIRTTECDIPMKEFGKTIFLTREEAEEVLKWLSERLT